MLVWNQKLVRGPNIFGYWGEYPHLLGKNMQYGKSDIVRWMLCIKIEKTEVLTTQPIFFRYNFTFSAKNIIYDSFVMLIFNQELSKSC